MFEKDPRKIINYLEQIKGKNHKKFKALNFACEGKAYKYNDQIVIPEFPMVWKESDFWMFWCIYFFINPLIALIIYFKFIQLIDF